MGWAQRANKVAQSVRDGKIKRIDKAAADIDRGSKIKFDTQEAMLRMLGRRLGSGVAMGRRPRGER